MLPNFLIVGAQKCGTTTLHSVLDNHPRIAMSRVKELNFFSFENNYQRGLKYYAKHFDGVVGEADIVGESSPGYLCYPGVPERIYKDLGNIKILILVRDPIKRAASQYWDNRRHLNETLSFDQCIENYLTEDYVPGERGYFSRGVYFKYIKRYIDLFGSKNVKVVVFEKLIKRTEESLSSIYEFLGIEDYYDFLTIPKVENSSSIYENPIYSYFLSNPGKVKYLPRVFKKYTFFGKKVLFKYPQPSQRALDSLKDFYNPWNLKLQEFLGEPIDEWWI